MIEGVPYVRRVDLRSHALDIAAQTTPGGNANHIIAAAKVIEAYLAGESADS
jgi:hypothetical protein